MSQTKVKSGLLNFPDQTDFVKLPSGTTAQRPSSPEEGYSRYNTTDDKLEYWNGTVWKQLPELDPPTLTSVDYPGNDLAADPAGGQTILINGTNFSAGISVEIGSTQVSSVTLNSTTQLAITSPALTAGDYDVTVTNLDAGTITALDFISYNGVPSWVTSSGSLGSLNFDEAISTISLSATEPDGGNVSYAITSGALPAGLTLSSSGDITGTMPSGSAETTYTFTVTATDDENQSTDRSFSITGVVPFVNNENFAAVTYTGGSVPYSVQVGFKPDLIWVKSRTNPYNHGLFDTLRPNGRYLKTNTTDAQSPSNDTAFHTLTDTGFTWTETSGGYNSTGDYVAWCWKAGGTPVSNENGTITSQVSANRRGGFSIFTWTGNGSSGETIGHGLDSAPEMLIIKNTSISQAWYIWHSGLSGDNYGLGFDNNGEAAFSFGTVGSKTSTIITALSGSNGISNLNTNGEQYVGYAFNSVNGYSKLGTYTGNASGNAIITGFEPSFIMVTKISGTTNSHWVTLDNKRNSSNPREKELYANLNNAENNLNRGVNFLSNGFELTSSSYTNDSGDTYVYMAFAENPNTQVPTKADSFNTVTYSGNGSAQNITGLGFQPDLVWIKNRNDTNPHALFDSVRGPGKFLSSQSTAAETGNTGNLLGSFDTDGFQVNRNYLAYTGWDTTNGANSPLSYVAWTWKAGKTPYINENGSIDSVVSANQASGFSIVKYLTPANNGNYTVGHGLSSAPDLLITKVLTIDGYRWTTYNSFSGPQYYMALDETRAATSYPAAFPVAPDSSLFTLSPTWPHPIGHSAIAYCFHSVAGFSKFGSYTGIGSGNVVVDCGFEPAFVMVKSSSNTGTHWEMMDNKRSPNIYNSTGSSVRLRANDNSTDAGFNNSPIKFTSTGFYLDSSVTANSYNDYDRVGYEYIYMAFANQF